MLKKYLVSTSGKQYYITKFYIIKIENVLRFGYDIFLINNAGVASMIDTINQSFINNPESDNIFNKLSSEKKFSKTISQLEALEVLHNLEKILNTEQTSQFIKVSLPQANLYYELNKIQLLYNFIKHFCNNYELIKLDFDKPDIHKQELKSENNIQIDDSNISSNLFNELIKLSPNNLVTFFILKQLTAFYTNQTVEFVLDEEQNLTISITKLTNNLMVLYNDLMTVINFVPANIADENFKNLLKSRITTLIKIIIFIYDNNDKLLINDKYLYLNYTFVLLYIYGFWLNNSDSMSLFNLYNFINKILMAFKFNSKVKTIKIEPTPLQGDTDVAIDLSTINGLANKYKYLIDIDRNRFVTNIINDTKTLINNKTNKFNINIPLNKAKLINLTNGNLPLKYEKIEDVKLSNHKIISKPYHSLLILENSKNIFNTDNIDENLPKLIDIIQNKMIPDLNKLSEQLILNPSTLFIYTECIEPNINNDLLNITEKLYLLYEVAIPYLFDRYNISKFLDYFH